MTNLFDQPNLDDNPVKVDDSVNYLNELVGEGKKFKTVEDLAKGKALADGYVDHLKSRLDEMRGDYTRLREEQAARAKLEDLLDQINTGRTQQKTETHQEPDVKQQQMPFDPKEMESLVQSKILEHESSKKQQDNYNLVRNKLQERLGDNYQAVLKEQTENLGLTEAFVNDLARNHPQVLFKTLGLDTIPNREGFMSPPRSNTRSDSFKPNVQKRSWSYYQKMKRDDPKKYRDSQTHVQMWKDHIELGKEFEDGDFDDGSLRSHI